jgi:very-short-patch-repair endonuclease
MSTAAAAWLLARDSGRVPNSANRPASLADLLREQDGVMNTTSALNWMSPKELRWRVASGRWRKPCHGIVVAHSGPMTEEQRLWAAVLWAGQGAVLAGLTAARLDRLQGFSGHDAGADQPIHLLVPSCRSVRRKSPGLPVVVHYSIALASADIHPLRLPPRTRTARSVVDAAAWMATDRGAQAVLAAGVQQRLVRVEDLAAVVARNQRLPHRAVIKDTLDDIAGGAQALSELDLTRLLRQHRLPEPDRQAQRHDSGGRRRWLDAVWQAARLIVEVDGIHHLDAAQYWADMDRDNDFTLDGYRVLRFPAFVVRYHPGYVAATIRDALRPPGERSPAGAGISRSRPDHE